MFVRVAVCLPVCLPVCVRVYRVCVRSGVLQVFSPQSVSWLSAARQLVSALCCLIFCCCQCTALCCVVCGPYALPLPFHAMQASSARLTSVFCLGECVCVCARGNTSRATHPSLSLVLALGSLRGRDGPCLCMLSYAMYVCRVGSLTPSLTHRQPAPLFVRLNEVVRVGGWCTCACR